MRRLARSLVLLTVAALFLTGCQAPGRRAVPPRPATGPPPAPPDASSTLPAPPMPTDGNGNTPRLIPPGAERLPEPAAPDDRTSLRRPPRRRTDVDVPVEADRSLVPGPKREPGFLDRMGARLRAPFQRDPRDRDRPATKTDDHGPRPSARPMPPPPAPGVGALPLDARDAESRQASFSPKDHDPPADDQPVRLEGLEFESPRGFPAIRKPRWIRPERTERFLPEEPDATIRQVSSGSSPASRLPVKTWPCVDSPGPDGPVIVPRSLVD